MQDQLLVDRTQQLQPSQTLHGDHQPVAAITRVLPQLIYNRRGQRSRGANAVLLERLDELLQLQAHEDRHESAWATQT